jgi:hypothetical protein
MSDFDPAKGLVDAFSDNFKRGKEEGKREAADEIERLRRKVDELNETIEFLDPPYGIYEIQDQLDEANERIEELESPYSVVLDRSVPPAPSLTIFGDAQRDTHIITHEQIKEAWKYANGVKESLQTRPDAIEALAKLGIVRCGRCGSGPAIAVDHCLYCGKFEQVFSK